MSMHSCALRTTALPAAIRPDLGRAPGGSAEALDAAVRDQVQAVVRQLRGAGPVLAPRVQDGSLRVVGAVYDLDTAQVTLLDGPGARP